MATSGNTCILYGLVLQSLYNFISILESHIQAMHYSTTRYFCDICQFATFQKNKLNQHKRKSHRYECNQCHMAFETSREKNQHEKDHFPKKSSKRKRY